MHEYIYDLKESLHKELKKLAEKGEMSVQSVDLMQKISSTLKNLYKICKIEEEEDEGYGYSGRSPMYSGRNSSGRRGGSYTMAGRYSGSDDFINRLEEVMYNSPDDRTRQDIERIMTRVRGM